MHDRPSTRGLLALGVLAVAFATAAAPEAHPSVESRCAIPKRPSLCRSFAAFRRPRRAADALPRFFRNDPPIRHVDRASARRLPSRRPNGYRFFMAAGRHLVCLMIASGHGEGAFTCGSGGDARASRLFLEESCRPGRRRHRVLFVQLMRDGVHSAVVRRMNEPALRRTVTSNLLVVDLPTPSRDYLPTAVEWRQSGHVREHRLNGGAATSC